MAAMNSETPNKTVQVQCGAFLYTSVLRNGMPVIGHCRKHSFVFRSAGIAELSFSGSL